MAKLGGMGVGRDGREQKVGFAEKKTAPIACRIVSCSLTVGACNGWERCRETMRPLVGARRSERREKNLKMWGRDDGGLE